jgi:deoxyribonuclease V
MKVKSLHDWNVTPKEAIQIQKHLAGKVKLKAGTRTPKIIAGTDISMNRNSTTVYAGIVLLEFPSLEVVDSLTMVDTVQTPYIPGLLSFREGPALLKLFSQVTASPDLIFFDGHGYAHPRRLGLACHMGLFLDVPTIGCAKSKLVGDFTSPENKKGASSKLVDKDNNLLGMVLRTKLNCKPVFISPGHKIDFATATRFALECTTKYRIPEPTRQAHLLVNRLRKSFGP